MVDGVFRLVPARTRPIVWLVFGACFALATAFAAPSTTLLPAPSHNGGELLAALALFVAFAAGFLQPLGGLFGVVVLATLEGAIRKWAVNDIDVFLAKDLLVIGIYAAVLPRISRSDWRRPWWLLAPLVGFIVLAFIETARSPSISQAVVGLRAYTIYVPLLWVGPALLRDRSRAMTGLLLTILALGIGESIFSVVQLLSTSSTLNKLVSGAYPAGITLNGVAYLRPTGTFMQSGTLAAFLFAALLVAFSFVGTRLTRKLYVAGVAGPIVLAWGIVYSAARALVGATLIALVVLVTLLLVRRRFTSIVLVLASLGVGFVLLFTVVPAVAGGGGASKGTPAGAPASNKPVELINERGKIVRIGVGKPKTIGQVSGFLGRASDFNTAGGGVGLWQARVKPQLELIKSQRFGHGTGTMTLGSEYAGGSGSFAGEGEYSKFAWELGLPGFVFYVWFVLAFAVAALLGLIRCNGPDRVAAAVGFGIVGIAPIWGAITFAPDYPILSILIYLLGGYSAWRGTVGRHIELREADEV